MEMSKISEADNASSTVPNVTILGAGPAGVAAAYALTKDRDTNVTVLERGAQVGGNSSSFQIDGVWCDFGSHRFHPVADPNVLQDVKDILGEDLLLRPRHGRIRLGGSWIHFPLKPVDAMLRLPKSFAASLMADSVLGKFKSKSAGPKTFETVLYDGLGKTISENFYFPYVKKLWGLDPKELAVKLAERRVSGSSVGKILLKMARMLPGLRSETAGRFFYPRKGFGQIVSDMGEKATEKGAEFQFGSNITRIERDGNKVVAVWTKDGDNEIRTATDTIWSTIPITTLIRLLDAPAEVQAAADAIEFRGMILIYLILETDQFTEYDAHYFPELSVPISRMSEPKNYSASTEPKGTTILCAELPADPGESWWEMTDDELGQHYCDWLASVGLPVNVKVRRTETRRLAHAYPVYDLEYEKNFDVMDKWLSGLEGILTFGRQGLFAHDNTHHAFAMAYGAADCFDNSGHFDASKWDEYRREFEHHVVED
jgi:protoporphyrinogen oxidase